VVGGSTLARAPSQKSFHNGSEEPEPGACLSQKGETPVVDSEQRVNFLGRAPAASSERGGPRWRVALVVSLLGFN
jgi:hypothetical protein